MSIRATIFGYNFISKRQKMFKARVINWVLLFSFMLNMGCAVKYNRISTLPAKNQTFFFKDGRQVIVSRKPNSIATIAASQEKFPINTRPSFIIAVNNLSLQPVTFSTENVAFTMEGKKLKVFSYQELVQEIEQQRRSAAMTHALIGATGVLGAAMDGGRTYHSGTYQTQTSIYGDNNLYTGNTAGVYSGTTYDPLATLQAQNTINAQTANNIAAVNSAADKQLNIVQNRILKKETVLPNTWYGGYVRISNLAEPQTPKTIKSTISIGKDVHEFFFIFAQEGQGSQKSESIASLTDSPENKNTETSYINDPHEIETHSKAHKQSVIEPETIEPQYKFFFQLGVGTPIAFSPGGKYFLSQHANSLKLIDVKNGREIKTFKSRPFLGADFSPDGNYILNLSYQAELIGTISGRLVQTFTSNAGYIYDFAFSSDGKYLLLAENKDVSLWDVFTGDKIKSFKGDNTFIRVTFGPNDKYVISWSDDWTLKVWDIISGREINSIAFWNSASFSTNTPSSGFFGDRADIAFSSDGNYMLYAAHSFKERFPHKVELWDVIEAKKVRIFDCLVKDTYDVFFTPDGKFMVAREKDCLILWDISAGKLAKQFKAEFNSVIFNNDGGLILTTEGGLGLDNPRITLWEFAKEHKIRTYMSKLPSVKSITFSKDGEYLYSANSDGTVNKWEINKGKMNQLINGDKSYKSLIVLDNYGENVLYKRLDHSFSLVNTNTGEEIKTISPALNDSSSLINASVLSRDGSLLVTKDSNNQLTVMNINKSSETKTFNNKHQINSMAISPDNRYLLAGCGNNVLNIYDLKKGLPAKTMGGGSMAAYFLGYGNSIISIAISPNNKYAAIANLNSIRLYNIATGEIELQYSISDYIKCLAFNHESKYLVSGNSDGVLKIWDLFSGKVIQALKGHDTAIEKIAISPDGEKAVSVSSDGLLCLWNIQKGELLAKFATYDNKEWVFLTPDGYFNASANGANYLNIRVSSTKVTGIEDYQLEYRRPDIVAQKIN